MLTSSHKNTDNKFQSQSSTLSISSQQNSHRQANSAQTVQSIWQVYRSVDFLMIPERYALMKTKILPLLIESHMVMKIPIQVLYSSLRMFDRVISSDKFSQSEGEEWDENKMFGLGVCCLYSYHKLEKIRSQPLSIWVKNISAISFCEGQSCKYSIDAESMRIWEEFIMRTLNYSLISPTRFEIFIALLSIWVPTQKQFYLSQYFLEISLFCNFQTILKEGRKNPESPQLSEFQICLSIAKMCEHFFPSTSENAATLSQFIQNEESINQISNCIFKLVVSAHQKEELKILMKKYEKHANLGISCLKFFRKN